MNYPELAAQVPRILFAQNSELTDCVTFQGIVTRAHEQVVNLLDHDAFETTLTNLRVTSTGILDLSDPELRVLEIRSLNLRVNDALASPTRPLLVRNLEALTVMFPGGGPGTPLYYAKVAPLRVRLFPAPASVAYVEAQVNVEPPIASAETPDTLLTSKYARLHDAAVLRHAAMFMKAWEDVDRYTAELQAAVAELNPAVARRRRDETGQRPRGTENVQGA